MDALWIVLKDSEAQIVHSVCHITMEQSVIPVIASMEGASMELRTMALVSVRVGGLGNPVMNVTQVSVLTTLLMESMCMICQPWLRMTLTTLTLKISTQCTMSIF